MIFTFHSHTYDSGYVSKLLKLLLFPPPMAGGKILSTNLGHNRAGKKQKCHRFLI
ncbi:MAG: hypothetical protein LBR79_01330 [Oscillospiraceae bacterium]|nr:hypothetical protein [Oscillospiraceae bacterium]